MERLESTDEEQQRLEDLVLQLKNDVATKRHVTVAEGPFLRYKGNMGALLLSALMVLRNEGYAIHYLKTDSDPEMRKILSFPGSTFEDVWYERKQLEHL